MAGFENNVMIAKNVNFNAAATSKPHNGIITAAGDLLIGTGNTTPLAEIAKGRITSPNSTILVGYAGGNITIDTGAVTNVSFVTDAGTATPSGNILNVNGAGGTTVSGSGNTILITAGGGGGSTSLTPDTGTSPVTALAGLITITGSLVAAGTNPIRTDGTGSHTLSIEVQKSVALISANATRVGLSNFNSSQFAVDANGFVTLAGGSSSPTLSMIPDAFTAPGSSPTLPNASGSIVLTGNQVASGVVGANVIRTDSLAANTITVEIQRSTTAAVSTIADNGVSHFNSGQFSVDANGFVSLSGGTAGTITGNSGGALSQTLGNWNILGDGSITTVGAGSTLTVELQGLTNHAVLVGAGTTTITKVGPTATTGQVLQNNAGADPSYSTATYPSTTTINQILYSSSNNVVAGLATANQGVLTTGATGTPVITPLATNGQIIIGSTAGVPAAANLTAGTGISITNGANSISIAVNPSVVGETITGNSGGALSPTAGNWNILGATVAAGTSPLVTAGAGSTLTINAQRSQALSSADNSKIGLSNYNSAQFTVDANGFVSLKGSSSNPGILGIHPNAISGTGTDPTIADASGNISILGLSVAAGSNPVRTVATSVNSITTLVQTASAGVSDATKIGLSSFDSAAFDVDANGFVQLNNGGIAATLFNVDANTAPGTNPVVPSATGAVTITGGQVASGVVGANVIRTESLAVNAYSVEIQRSTTNASSDSSKNGVSHYKSTNFTVDTNGLVSSIPSIALIPGATNLGMKYAASTFSICSADGTALSASNPGFVTLQSSTTPGILKTYTITANQTFVDSTGASTITGNTFGVSTAVGVSWSNDMPFYVYAVSDSTEASISFMICRIPAGTISPVAGSIGKTGSAIADSQGAFFALGNPTIANYAQQACLCIGAFRMRSTNNVADWIVQALSNGSVSFGGGETTQVMADGIGNYHEGSKFWQGLQTMGANANTIMSGIGAPTYAGIAHPISYRISKSGEVSLFFSQGTTGGGTGSNSLTYQSLFIPNASGVGSGSSTTQIFLPKFSDNDNDVTFAFVDNASSQLALNSDMPLNRACRFFLSYQPQFL